VLSAQEKEPTLEDKIYFEEVEIGKKVRIESYEVTKEEIISYATKWDPQFFHIDEEAAKDSVFGGLCACTAHTIAIQSWLANQTPKPYAVMAGLGTKEMYMRAAVRPGDVLSLETTILDKRLSKSKPDRGIATTQMHLVNQNDEIVLEAIGVVMISCRPVTK
jgi:acyl dehydratase